MPSLHAGRRVNKSMAPATERDKVFVPIVRCVAVAVVCVDMSIERVARRILHATVPAGVVITFLGRAYYRSLDR